MKTHLIILALLSSAVALQARPVESATSVRRNPPPPATRPLWNPSQAYCASLREERAIIQSQTRIRPVEDRSETIGRDFINSIYCHPPRVRAKK